MKMHRTDVLIIGGGLAGLMAAKCLFPHKNVIMITKSTVNESNSIRAQGGIAAAVGQGDHWSKHYDDTLAAGGGHNDHKTTEQLVKSGVEAVNSLMNLGVPFDRDDAQNVLLGREGAHGINRILHAGGDATGKAIVETLMNDMHSKLNVHESCTLIDFIVTDGRCSGAVTKNHKSEIVLYEAEHTVVATGGIGGLYEWTSNDDTVTGDGLAAAFRAGADLADLEFVQFHPTMLIDGNHCGGLISEAVRGEGARLVTEDGTPVMAGVHQQLDLAPRDIVARTTESYIRKGQSVFLDISAVSDFPNRFPTIYKTIKALEINLAAGRIPVAPGAHFIMGGIKTDNRGRTSLPGLYAVGEAACTGVHGANRLASNSLLEAMVFARRMAEGIIEQRSFFRTACPSLPVFAEGRPNSLPNKAEIQQRMMTYAGMNRDQAGLTNVKNWLEQYLTQTDENLILKPVEDIEIINMLTSGWLIATSALMRTESRGGHYRTDYPSQKENWKGRRIVRNTVSLRSRHLGIV